jgi:GNAT superfamily N-acetyltransferase
MTIRKAVAEDRDELLAMGQRFHSSTPYSTVIRWNPVQLARVIDTILESGVFYVAEDRGGALVGVIGVFVTLHPLSGDPVATELLWWVEPAARGDSTAVRLLKDAEAWAKAAGALGMIMVAPDVRTGQFYERLGYRSVETSYLRTF